MENLDIEKFDPSVAEIQAIVSRSEGVTVTDFTDRAQLEAVKDARLTLRDARVAITKKGKELRDDALQFQRAVIAKEKELVALIEPEESRLQALEDEAKHLALMAERRALLPQRREQLKKIDPNADAKLSDEDLMALDATQFQSFLNVVMAEKNAADAKLLEEERKKLELEKADENRRKELAEAEERGRKEAAEKAERERKDEEDRKEKARLAEIERVAEEKRKLESQQAYQAFLRKHGCTPENRKEYYTTQDLAGSITLWKKVAVYNPEDLEF